MALFTVALSSRFPGPPWATVWPRAATGRPGPQRPTGRNTAQTCANVGQQGALSAETLAFLLAAPRCESVLLNSQNIESAFPPERLAFVVAAPRRPSVPLNCQNIQSDFRRGRARRPESIGAARNGERGRHYASRTPVVRMMATIVSRIAEGRVGHASITLASCGSAGGVSGVSAAPCAALVGEMLDFSGFLGSSSRLEIRCRASG